MENEVYEINEVERRNLKQYGLTKYIINSIALFVYYDGYKINPDVIDIFNRWAKACNIRIHNTETLSLLLEHIKRLAALDSVDLGKALKADGFIITAPIPNNGAK